jgi:predicted O-methyltransferase YrrM
MISWWENDRWVGKKDLAISLMVATRFGQGPRVMEVGLWRGGWTLHVAMNLGISRGTAIDPYLGLEEIRNTTLNRFERLEIALDLHESWDSCERTSRFDLIHIDGEHSEAAALHDLRESVQRLSPGGVIIVDDWLQPDFIGVNSAVHRFLSEADFRIVLTTEWKAYLTSAATAQDWHSYLVAQLGQLGKIPFEVDASKGLGDYSEARTVLDHSVIVALGKPSDLLVNDGQRDAERPLGTRISQVIKRLASIFIRRLRRSSRTREPSGSTSGSRDDR